MKPDWKVLDRYLLGEASPEEREAAERYFRDKDGDLLRGVLARPVEYPEGKDGDTAWRDISKNIVRAPAALPKEGYKWARHALVGLAAMAAIVAGINYLPGPTVTAESKTYSTARGQRATITLLDGSIVMLAPATTIKVSNREVDLAGEAVFTVTNHKAAPFTVKTGNTVSRVLGTTFSIRAYDSNVRIAVRDGKIDANKTVLVTGDVAIIRDNRVSLRHNADIESLFSWTTGILSFEGTPVNEVVAELERSFDIQITVASQRAMERRVTMAVRLANPPREVVSTLAMALGVNAAWDGNRAVLK